jgi:hypothetical protein
VVAPTEQSQFNRQLEEISFDCQLERPLGEAAMAIIKETKQTCEAFGLDSEYVFTNTNGAPISGWSKATTRLDRYMRAELAELSNDERAAQVVKGILVPQAQRQ